jgi:opacity protein-like surface antigen
MKMKKVLVWMLVFGFAVGLTTARAQEDAHRIGVGVNYWFALDDLDSDIDENGFSYLASYQWRPSVIGLQLDFEMLPDRFGEDAYAPAAYVIFGKAIYAAAGVGIVNQDGDWADDPFFALKAGLDLNILANLYVDIAVSYRFDADTQLDDAVDDISTDTLFLGAALRLGF